MKTVEGLLEKGLIEVANKEEELKVCVFSLFHKGRPHITKPQEASENMLPQTQTHLTHFRISLLSL